jgi:hypothetical protein
VRDEDNAEALRMQRLLGKRDTEIGARRRRKRTETSDIAEL